MNLSEGKLDLVGMDQGYLAGLLDSQEIVRRDLCREFSYETVRLEFKTKEKEAADKVSGMFGGLGVNVPVVFLQEEGLLGFSVTIPRNEALCFLYSYVGTASSKRKQDIKNIIRAQLGTEDALIESYDLHSPGYRLGWLTGMLDASAGFTRNKNGYQMYWSSTNSEIYGYLSSIMGELGLETKEYAFPEKRGRDRYHFRITKGSELVKLYESVPFRLESQKARVKEVVDWVSRVRTKYDPHVLAKLHFEQGMSISDIARHLGEKTGSGGRLAAQMRRAGYDIKSKQDNHKPKEPFTFTEQELEKGYELLKGGMTATNVLATLGKNPDRSTAFYNKLEGAGYDLSEVGLKRGKNKPKLDAALVVKMHIEDGLPPAEIAKHFGYEDSSRGGWIANIIRKAGYEPITNKSIYKYQPEKDTVPLPKVVKGPLPEDKGKCCICHKVCTNHRYYLHLWNNSLVIKHDVALTRDNKEEDLGLYKVGNDCIKKYNLFPYRVTSKEAIKYKQGRTMAKEVNELSDTEVDQLWEEVYVYLKERPGFVDMLKDIHHDISHQMSANQVPGSIALHIAERLDEISSSNLLDNYLDSLCLEEEDYELSK